MKITRRGLVAREARVLPSKGAVAFAADGVAAAGAGRDRSPPRFAVGANALDATMNARATPFGALVLAVATDFGVGGELGVIPVVRVGGAAMEGFAGVIHAKAAGVAPTGVAVDAETETIVVVSNAAIAAVRQPFAMAGSVQPCAGTASGAAVKVRTDETFLCFCDFREKGKGPKNQGKQKGWLHQFHGSILLREDDG